MIVFLSSIYFFLGAVYLLIPSIALELGRPKDLLKGGLFFLLAIFLTIKKESFNNSELFILVLNNFICFIFIVEINLVRWNNLLDKEKNSFKKFSLIKKKLLLFLDALNLGFKNLTLKSLKASVFNENVERRTWVRSEKANPSQNLNLVAKDSRITNPSREDIIVDEK